MSMRKKIIKSIISIFIIVALIVPFIVLQVSQDSSISKISISEDEGVYSSESDSYETYLSKYEEYAVDNVDLSINQAKNLKDALVVDGVVRFNENESSSSS